MPTQTAGKHGFFDITTKAHQICRCVAVANAMDILFDDRACVEFLGHIVAGSANQFNAPLVSLVVGLSSGKKRAKNCGEY